MVGGYRVLQYYTQYDSNVFLSFLDSALTILYCINNEPCSFLTLCLLRTISLVCFDVHSVLGSMFFGIVSLEESVTLLQMVFYSLSD